MARERDLSREELEAAELWQSVLDELIAKAEPEEATALEWLRESRA